MRWTMAATATLFVAGCANTPEYFRPTERTQGFTRSGEVEAVYSVDTAGGRLGEVKVSSAGAHRHEGMTRIEVDVTLENTSNQPMSLDLRGVWLDDVRTDDGTFSRIPAATYAGQPTVNPGEAAEVTLYFDLPANVTPQNVDAFHVYWRVSGPAGTYAQLTPFAEDEGSYGYAPVGFYGFTYPYGYYDPFYGPYPYPYAYGYFPPAVYVAPSRTAVIRDHRRRY